MVETFSWLYGASQSQECRFCHDLVYPLGATLRSHEFWCDARKIPVMRTAWLDDSRSNSIPQRRIVGTEEARTMLERVSR